MPLFSTLLLAIVIISHQTLSVPITNYVSHFGCSWATIDNIDPTSSDLSSNTENGCQRNNWFPIPDGWEIPPENDANSLIVASTYPWATDVLLWGYPSQAGGDNTCGRTTLWSDVSCSQWYVTADISADQITYKPKGCRMRILIRQCFTQNPTPQPSVSPTNKPTMSPTESLPTACDYEKATCDDNCELKRNNCGGRHCHKRYKRCKRKCNRKFKKCNKRSDSSENGRNSENEISGKSSGNNSQSMVIGIVVPIGVILLLGIIFGVGFYCKRKNNKLEKVSMDDDEIEGQIEMTETVIQE